MLSISCQGSSQTSNHRFYSLGFCLRTVFSFCFLFHELLWLRSCVTFMREVHECVCVCVPSPSGASLLRDLLTAGLEEWELYWYSWFPLSSCWSICVRSCILRLRSFSVMAPWPCSTHNTQHYTTKTSQRSAVLMCVTITERACSLSIIWIMWWCFCFQVWLSSFTWMATVIQVSCSWSHQLL